MVFISCRCVQWGKEFQSKKHSFLTYQFSIADYSNPSTYHYTMTHLLLSCLFACSIVGKSAQHYEDTTNILGFYHEKTRIFLDETNITILLWMHTYPTLLYWSGCSEVYLYLINSYIRGWRKYPYPLLSIHWSVCYVLLVHFNTSDDLIPYLFVVPFLEQNRMGRRTPHNFMVVVWMFNGQITMLSWIDDAVWIQPYESINNHILPTDCKELVRYLWSHARLVDS